MNTYENGGSKAGRKEGRSGESLRYILLVSVVDNCVGEIRRAE